MEAEDYIKNIEGAERRFFMAPVTVEIRAEGDADKPAIIEGYAAMYNQRADLGWYEEEILPGAFDDVLMNDVRCLYNHNANFVLARSNQGKGTLSLSLDSTGLKYRYETPNRSYALDLADAIEKGDVSQSSFAFRVKETIWIERTDEKELRQIKKFEQLIDVSPVTYPAYPDTTVAKRSLEAEKPPVEKETEPSRPKLRKAIVQILKLKQQTH
jgi:HK97 family phage prohead protease